ncbi:SAM-dependent methyltransferase, partial [Frankia sp. CgMI4]|uniref:SAM-dependent methyltransferase n=1 Tax=Frankia sp. CgMI4 TaxID=1742262 RepID=UPI0020C7C112
MAKGDNAGWTHGSVVPDWAPPNVDLKSDVPHSARVYDYILGGKENFPADRAAAAEFTRSMPNLPTSMRANRNFMVRMARVLAAGTYSEIPLGHDRGRRDRGALRWGLGGRGQPGG